jgi:hypothetical protein
MHARQDCAKGQGYLGYLLAKPMALAQLPAASGRPRASCAITIHRSPKT